MKWLCCGWLCLLALATGSRASAQNMQVTIVNKSSTDLAPGVLTTQPLVMKSSGPVWRFGTSRQVTDGVIAGGTTLSSATALFSASDVRASVSAPGQPDATITSFTNATTVTISPAWTNGSGQSVTIAGIASGPQPSQALLNYAVGQVVVSSQLQAYSVVPGTGTYDQVGCGGGGCNIRTLGTNSGLTIDDELSPVVDFAGGTPGGTFRFILNGVTYTQGRTSSNGFLALDPITTYNSTTYCRSDAAPWCYYKPISIPAAPSLCPPNVYNTTRMPSNILAPFWEDLNPQRTPAPSAGAPSIRYMTIGTYPNRIFIQGWYLIPFYNAASSDTTMSFEVALHEADSTDGTANRVEFRYGNPTCPTGCTCGNTRAVTDGSVVSGMLNRLSSATAAFVAADVGARVTSPGQPTVTISAVNSATNVTLSANWAVGTGMTVQIANVGNCADAAMQRGSAASIGYNDATGSANSRAVCAVGACSVRPGDAEVASSSPLSYTMSNTCAGAGACPAMPTGPPPYAGCAWGDAVTLGQNSPKCNPTCSGTLTQSNCGVLTSCTSNLDSSTFISLPAIPAGSSYGPIKLNVTLAGNDTLSFLAAVVDRTKNANLGTSYGVVALNHFGDGSNVALQVTDASKVAVSPNWLPDLGTYAVGSTCTQASSPPLAFVDMANNCTGDFTVGARTTLYNPDGTTIAGTQPAVNGTTRTMTDGAVAGGTSLTSATAAFTATDIGATVTSAGQTNRTITAVNSATSVTMSGTWTNCPTGCPRTFSVLGKGPSRTSPLINLPFTFIFMGKPYRQVVVAQDGYVSVDVTDALTADIMPATSLPSAPLTNMIAAFWDRFGSATNGCVNPSPKYATLGTSPNRVFVVGWYGAQLDIAGCGSRVNVELALHEGTNQIELVYGTTVANPWTNPPTLRASGSAATIGIEASNGSTFKQFAGVSGVGVVKPGLSLTIGCEPSPGSASSADGCVDNATYTGHVDSSFVIAPGCKPASTLTATSSTIPQTAGLPRTTDGICLSDSASYSFTAGTGLYGVDASIIENTGDYSNNRPTVTQAGQWETRGTEAFALSGVAYVNSTSASDDFIGAPLCAKNGATASIFACGMSGSATCQGSNGAGAAPTTFNPPGALFYPQLWQQGMSEGTMNGSPGSRYFTWATWDGLFEGRDMSGGTAHFALDFYRTARRVSDGAVTGGTTLSSATAMFTSADVGAYITSPGQPVANVTAFASATQVTIVPAWANASGLEVDIYPTRTTTATCSTNAAGTTLTCPTANFASPEDIGARVRSTAAPAQGPSFIQTVVSATAVTIAPAFTGSLTNRTVIIESAPTCGLTDRDYFASGVAMSNVETSDTSLEAVVASWGQGIVYVLDHSTSALTGACVSPGPVLRAQSASYWSDATNPQNYSYGSVPAVGDLDNNGNPDIIAAFHNDAGTGMVVRLEVTNLGTCATTQKCLSLTERWRFVSAGATYYWTSPIVGDFDGDGVWDVAVQSSNDAMLHVLSAAPSVTGCTPPACVPTELWKVQIGPSGQSQGAASPIAIDANGDGVLDVVAASYRDIASFPTPPYGELDVLDVKNKRMLGQFTTSDNDTAPTPDVSAWIFPNIVADNLLDNRFSSATPPSLALDPTRSGARDLLFPDWQFHKLWKVSLSQLNQAAQVTGQPWNACYGCRGGSGWAFPTAGGSNTRTGQPCCTTPGAYVALCGTRALPVCYP